MHHWVNGGGGAYLSFGTSLAWPSDTDIANWAYYPSQKVVVEKIVGYTCVIVLVVWSAAWRVVFIVEWLLVMLDYKVGSSFRV